MIYPCYGIYKFELWKDSSLSIDFKLPLDHPWYLGSMIPAAVWWIEYVVRRLAIQEHPDAREVHVIMGHTDNYERRMVLGPSIADYLWTSADNKLLRVDGTVHPGYGRFMLLRYR